MDDRGGAVKKLTPELYGAIIDEAHKNNLRVAVHATGLADAKDLLRAGIDIFAHMISDVDDELVALFKQHPNVAVLLALGGPHRAVYAPWLDPGAPAHRSKRSRPSRSSGCRSRFPTATPEQLARSRPALGSAGQRHQAAERRGRAGSASAPTAADSRAISSSAGRCTPSWRTW